MLFVHIFIWAKILCNFIWEFNQKHDKTPPVLGGIEQRRLTQK